MKNKRKEFRFGIICTLEGKVIAGNMKEFSKEKFINKCQEEFNHFLNTKIEVKEGFLRYYPQKVDNKLQGWNLVPSKDKASKVWLLYI